MPAARQALRDATAQIHEALHGAAPFARIAAGTMDSAGYGALLNMLWRYHAMMAPACAAGALLLEAPELDAAHQERLAALRADLAVLGFVPSPASEAAAVSGAFALGCLYTVLGSTLGGKVIDRQLTTLLPDGHGRSFFQGTADDGARWGLFCAGLETACETQSIEQVAAGARYAFACFKRLLEMAETEPA